MSDKTAATEEKNSKEAPEAARNAASEAPEQPRAETETAAEIDAAAANGTEPAEESLEASLAAANEKAEDNWNQYLRAVAELDNTRKRAARDIEQARRFAIERFAADLLAVKDSLEMGLNAATDSQDQAGALLEGTEMTLKQLAQVFEKFGITEIDPKGEKFDPEQHEAMATQPSAEAEPDTVLTVVQKGYLLNGRVLRAARVLVARPPEDANKD
ncbi:MAG TPA: nucleotide exchange factor GrpE [Gammaproteobacteria bacterium]